MPTNLYGPNDNYHPTHSHVLPALIRRFHEAKVNGLKEVTCWGDGSPLREFLYVDDLANLCVFLMNNYSGDETVNAGTGKELTIKEEKVRLLKEIPSEENLWQAVIAFQDYPFKTATGLPFRYKLKVGKNGGYNRELMIDRREKSKSLAWSSVVLAFENSKRVSEEVKKPKALGDIRGVSYIYPILWRFGLIRVPEAIEKKMGKQR